MHYTAWTGCTRSLSELDCNLAEHIVHHDKDAVHTGYVWLKRVHLKEDAIASYAQHGAKNHPWIESFWGHFKIENGEVCQAYETMSQLPPTVADRVTYYNECRHQSALNYRRPKRGTLDVINRGQNRPRSLT